MSNIASSFEIFGSMLVISEEKNKTNNLRKMFDIISNEWSDKIYRNFYSTFSDLDDLYDNIDDLSDECRMQSINLAMKVLVSHGIYDMSEESFQDEFMDDYDSFDEDFEPISDNYEAIKARSASLDAHRTARRHNRRQWIGYGSKEAVYDADGKNAVSNIGHGIFNLMAKGVTAIGDSYKKSEIFKSDDTRILVTDAFSNIPFAAFWACIDAVNKELPGTYYSYSEDEIAKTDAILENISRNRIPTEAIPASLVKAMDIYPYSQDIYDVFLVKLGGNSGRLDMIVDFFGMTNLAEMKINLIEEKIKKIDFSSIEKIHENLPALKSYSDSLNFDGFDEIEKRLNLAAQTKIMLESTAPINNIENLKSQNDEISHLKQRYKSIKEIGFYATPELPYDKVNKFIEKNKLTISADKANFYLNDSLFPSGIAGVLLDSENIYSHIMFEKNSIPIKDITNIEIRGLINKTITVLYKPNNKAEIKLSQSNAGAELMFEVINEMMKLKLI